MGNIYRFIEPALLMLLHEKGRSYGYELAEGIEAYALTDSQVDRSALYRTLRALEENGFVHSKWETESIGPARRVYSLTKPGREHLREWSQLMDRLGGALQEFSRRVHATL
jgi:DNA-binding PadR family transcriptional regulator